MRLCYFLDVSPEGIDQIDAGKRQPTGSINVAMIQSLSRKGVVDDIVANYGHLVVDECHHITNSDERNQMILNDILQVISTGRFPVILTERKKHLEELRCLIEDKVQNLIVMKGGMGKKQRDAALEVLESLPPEAEKAITPRIPRPFPLPISESN